MSRLLSSLARDEVLYAVTSTRHILINTEGRVHPTTFTQPGRDTRHTQGSENKVKVQLSFIHSSLHSVRYYIIR